MTKDHAQEMLDRLLAQFQGKPRMEALIRSLGEALNLCEKTLVELQDKRWIDTAETVQLDGCGQIVDQARIIDRAIALPFFGLRSQPSARGFSKARFRGRLESHLTSARLGDAEYRKMIHAKIAKNISNGTTEELINSFRSIFNARIIVTEMGDAKLRVGVSRELLEGEQVFAKAVKLFIKPGGVGIDKRIYFSPPNTFGFKSQNLRGFGQGKFAKTF